MSLGPVYARHSAGDTNEPESAETQFIATATEKGSGVPCLLGPVWICDMLRSGKVPSSQKHSPAVKLFAWVPLGAGGLFSPESAPGSKKKVRPSGSFRGKGRCVGGSSQEPPVVHAGSAAKRMCLREFNQAIDNTQPGKFPPGKGPVRGGGQNACFSCLAILIVRTHTRPQNSGFCKIASRISGSLPALATAGSGG